MQGKNLKIEHDVSLTGYTDSPLITTRAFSPFFMTIICCTWTLSQSRCRFCCLDWLLSGPSATSVSAWLTERGQYSQSGQPTRGDHKTLITCKARTALFLTLVRFSSWVQPQLALHSHSTWTQERVREYGCLETFAWPPLHARNNNSNNSNLSRRVDVCCVATITSIIGLISFKLFAAVSTHCCCLYFSDCLHITLTHTHIKSETRS